MKDYQIRVEMLKSYGAQIGKDCRYFSHDIPIKRDCPLLNIGDNVTVSGNVAFLCHDNAVIKSNLGFTDLIGKIEIGDNCFIGYGSIILPGVHLAKNTIVAAGSVVCNSIEQEGFIVGGNPARIIGTVQDYYDRNRGKMVNLYGNDNNDIKKIIENHPEKILSRKIIGY